MKHAIPLLTALLLASAAIAAERVEVEGSVHVRNGASPSQGTAELTPKLLWERGGDDDDILFGVPGQLIVDEDGTTYVLDRQLSEVQVFDSEGEWLRTVGREGEGPGEFRNAVDLCFMPGGALGVIQQQPGKVVMMDREGEPIGDFPIDTGGGFFFAWLGLSTDDRLVLASSTMNPQQNGLQRMISLKSFSPDGTELASFHDDSYELNMATLEFDERELDDFSRNWTIASDGRVYVADLWDEYAIRVVDPEGNLDYVLTRDWNSKPRSDEEREEAGSRFGININGRDAEILTATADRVVQDIVPRGDGNVWVLNAAGAEGGDGYFASFDEFDASGEFTRTIDVKVDGDPDEDRLFVRGDRAYVVQGIVAASAALGPGDDEGADEEDEPRELKILCYALDG